MVIQDGVDTSMFCKNNNHKNNGHKLVVGWAGNSNWRAVDGGNDHKGFGTIIKPVIEELNKEGYPVELKYADASEKTIPFFVNARLLPLA